MAFLPLPHHKDPALIKTLSEEGPWHLLFPRPREFPRLWADFQFLAPPAGQGRGSQPQRTGERAARGDRAGPPA